MRADDAHNLSRKAILELACVFTAFVSFFHKTFLRTLASTSDAPWYGIALFETECTGQTSRICKTVCDLQEQIRVAAQASMQV